jgi:predicted Zn-dependent protease
VPIAQGLVNLCRLRRFDEADALADVGIATFLQDPEIWSWRGHLAHARRDWTSAISRWADVRALFGELPAGWSRGIDALIELDRLDEAERLLETVPSSVAENAEVLLQAARLATKRKDWPEATQRWERGSRAYPDDTALREGLRAARLAWQFELADSGGAREAVEAAAGRIDEPEANTRLLMGFESLGGNCEFGIVQASADVNTLGLLRWCSIRPAQLEAALANGFDGIGQPENTELKVGGDDEYSLIDRRYFQMHTFIKTDQGKPELLFRQMCRRLTFLKDKLIADLSAGEKIFVYKTPNGLIEDAEIRAIWRAMRRFGDRVLFCVRLHDDAHPAGTVERLSPTLFVGYLDRVPGKLTLNETSRDCWLALCRTVADMVEKKQTDPIAMASLTPELPFSTADEGLKRAHAANAAGNADLAQTIWAAIRERFPDRSAGYVDAALALRHRKRPEEAERLLSAAVARYPGEGRVWIEYIMNAAVLRNGNEMFRRSELMRERFSDRVEGYAMAAAALTMLKRFDEAEGLANAALARFSDDVHLWVELGKVAMQRQDWNEATRRWETIRVKFPGNPVGYVEGATALRKLDRHAEAEGLLISGMERLPRNAQTAQDYASMASWRRDWPEAEKRWRRVMDEFPYTAAVCFGLSSAMIGVRKLNEAESLLKRGMEQFPEEMQLHIAHARVAAEKADRPQLLARWEAINDRFAERPEAEAGLVHALLEAQRPVDAEKILERAVSRIPHHASLAFSWGKAANSRRDWKEAKRRWELYRDWFPDNLNYQAGLGAALLGEGLAGLDEAAESKPEAAPPVSAKEAKPEDDRSVTQLLMQFESIGDNCEFGLAQRRFGAEPLGLLRWAGISADRLVVALDAGFEGVGTPEQTELEARREYFLKDSRFQMNMHTFIDVKDGKYDDIYAKMCRRLRYLREKFLKDLREPGKVFVFKAKDGVLRDDQIAALHRSIRSYGPGSLLCVRLADGVRKAGTVELVGNDLMIGYIDRLSPRADYSEISFDCWLEICRQAHRIWSENVARPSAA